jgi:hypothetical protein
MIHVFSTIQLRQASIGHEMHSGGIDAFRGLNAFRGPAAFRLPESFMRP